MLIRNKGVSTYTYLFSRVGAEERSTMKLWTGEWMNQILSHSLLDISISSWLQKIPSSLISSLSSILMFKLYQLCNLLADTTGIPHPHSSSSLLTSIQLQHPTQIWSTEYSLQFLGNSFWLFQHPDLTPEDEKKIAIPHISYPVSIPPTPLAFSSSTSLRYLDPLPWRVWGDENIESPDPRSRRNVLGSTFPFTLCVTLRMSSPCESTVPLS